MHSVSGGKCRKSTCRLLMVSKRDAVYESPAREPLAITVGATDISDALASFSNFGKSECYYIPCNAALDILIIDSD